jgi:hypothetical protein
LKVNHIVANATLKIEQRMSEIHRSSTSSSIVLQQTNKPTNKQTNKHTCITHGITDVP